MKTPIITRLLAAAIAAGTLLPLTAQAWEKDKLLIWINGDKGYRGLQQVGDKFAKELGVPVKVEAPEGVTDKFFQAAQSGKGPDIFMWPHDRLGEWADAGILKPVDIDAATKAKIFPKAWDAFTHKQRIWAYPMSLEALGLIYNTKLVTGTPPATLDDVIKLAPDLQKKNITPIMWDYGTPFFSWGFLASGGGYVYKRGSAGYDLNDIGVNTPGAIKALEQIVSVINQGIMPKGTTYSVMESKMNSGELAMMISGPWAWGNLRKSGIPFAVAPMLGANGQTGKPFVGVLGAMINRSTPNTDLAEEFLKNYLLTDDGLRTMNADVPLGVPALQSFYKELSKDPAIAATKASVDAGELMPNIPEMGRFWSSLQAALSNATNGQSTPKDALDHAASRMKDAK
ncbi:maltose/maltodextrin ABC transporter substrate-binding protein MalE [Opitutaceae bacterium TAV4]|nr:maltose/maltodextrin ABC transporter substrate-binding protein MalE [Opitutaceae bacterium TAV4]RRJ99010.1 maltose/maltodextrin ABC transporter substrate-binding protein MalE [Opitutaceae bacterium TAV3]